MLLRIVAIVLESSEILFMDYLLDSFQKFEACMKFIGNTTCHTQCASAEEPLKNLEETVEDFQQLISHIKIPWCSVSTAPVFFSSFTTMVYSLCLQQLQKVNINDIQQM